MIIKLGTTIQYTSSGIDSSSFSVTKTKEGLSTSEQRTINKAYVSDEKGNSITQNSNYITLELSCHNYKKFFLYFNKFYLYENMGIE